MMPDIRRELHGELSRGSPARLSFTRKAFQMLPNLENPRILDVGCGQGGPTLELARLSGGHVTGLDIDQSALHELAKRADEEGLADHIQVVHGSMFDMQFKDESFDVIWAEGSMHILGFERALGEWRRFIWPGGFLVVHEMIWLRPDPPAEVVKCPELAYPGMRTVPEYIEQVLDHGYRLLGHLVLPEDLWLLDYFDPMTARMRELRRKYAADQAAQRTLDREQRVADLFGDRLRVTREITPEALILLVPSLVLQPLVENTVQHGQGDDGSVDLGIDIHIDGERAVIVISDQGPGMPARHTIGASPGHGLYSVDQRLRKSYGEAYGLEIGANQPQGTLVALSIPVGIGG